MKLRRGSPEEVGMLPERIDRARGLCAEWVKSGHTPALAVCVARRGVVVLEEAFGQSGVGADAKPLERDSIWAVASVSKPITAALVMQLVDEGLLGLNRPAIEYLPELEGEGVEEILVHHLLTHTSGYPWHTDPSVFLHAKRKLDGGFEASPCPADRHLELHRRLELFWDLPRDHPAGESMTYSNFNYELLGELVRRLRGMAFEDAAREYIFEPLGMNDSYFALPESLLHRYVIRPPDAIGAEGSLGFPSLNSRAFHAAPNAGAGLCTTPFDMATFGQMILSGGALRGTRVLSRASVVAMSRDQIPGLEANMAGNRMKPASWSYGFAVESSFKWPYFRGSLSTLGSLCHPGACGSSFWIDPARELVACYVEVCMEISEDLLFLCNNDLFENVIQSAIDD